nr:ankyrin repeat domain-containing protein 26-like isoform X2 [Equus asinus]
MPGLLPRNNERLLESSTELLLKKQQNRSSLSALTARPVLEPPCARRAAAEFEPGPCRASPLGSADESNLNQDLVLKTSQEYVQILKKNYMI